MGVGRKKILFVAYTFPPIPYGGTFRALRLCRGLSEQDIECHVITIKEYADIPNDYDLLTKVPDSVHVHRTPIIDPWRRYQSFKKQQTGKFWPRVVNKLISLLLLPITFPDHMLLWVPFAVLRARQVIKKHNIDTVLVSSPPDSSQLVGLILKKLYKVHWLADFRDPIYGNVAQINMINPTHVLDRLQKNLLVKYDRLIATSADVLIANTETHAGTLRKYYGCTNVHVIRNSFDSIDFLNNNVEKYPELTISHVGSIYGKRNPNILFSAINLLAAECAPETLRLKVIFIGLGGNSISENIERHGVCDYVTVKDQVPHHEAIETMRRSHLLLLIKATGKWSQGQIPGKFFEYIGSRNPILCVGPKESEVADIIRENDLGYIVEDNQEEMLNIMRGVYRQFNEKGSLPTPLDVQTEPFSSKAMVDKMSKIIRDIR
jgi:hypothetical protein